MIRDYSLFWQWIFWFMFRFISYSSFNREQQCCLTKHNGSKNVAGVIRSYSWIKEEFLLHLDEGNRWSDCYARLPQRLYLLILFVDHLIVNLNCLKFSPPTSLRTVGWRLTGWAHKKRACKQIHIGNACRFWPISWQWDG